MILHDLRLYGRDGYWNIQVNNSRIAAITPNNHIPGKKEDLHISFDGALCLPGFINCHDHLDFNLFPKLGHPPYKNYRDWGPSVQEENKEQVRKILAIPEQLRIEWGMLKNLLNGFTTVINHGKKIKIPANWIDVYQQVQSLHSVGFEKNWKRKLNNPLKINQPVIIHTGEGIDEEAHIEINELIKANILKRKLIGVHGVSMDLKQASAFSGLIWCPASNYYLFEKTASIDVLKTKTTVLFGTDSTLTAGWNAWEHFRMGIKNGMVTERELLDILTMNPRKVFGLPGKGVIEEKAIADLLVIPNSTVFDQNPPDILFVLKNGEVQLADSTLKINQTGFTKIELDDSVKFLKGDITNLYNGIKSCLGESFSFMKFIS